MYMTPDSYAYFVKYGLGYYNPKIAALKKVYAELGQDMYTDLRMVLERKLQESYKTSLSGELLSHASGQGYVVDLFIGTNEVSVLLAKKTPTGNMSSKTVSVNVSACTFVDQSPSGGIEFAQYALKGIEVLLDKDPNSVNDFIDWAKKRLSEAA